MSWRRRRRRLTSGASSTATSSTASSASPTSTFTQVTHPSAGYSGTEIGPDLWNSTDLQQTAKEEKERVRRQSQRQRKQRTSAFHRAADASLFAQSELHGGSIAKTKHMQVSGAQGPGSCIPT